MFADTNDRRNSTLLAWRIVGPILLFAIAFALPVKADQPSAESVAAADGPSGSHRWLGVWRTKAVTSSDSAAERESIRGHLAFGFDPTSRTQTGYLSFEAESVVQEFTYELDDDADGESGERRTRFVFGFADDVKLRGECEMAADGTAAQLKLEPSPFASGIRDVELVRIAAMPPELSRKLSGPIRRVHPRLAEARRLEPLTSGDYSLDGSRLPTRVALPGQVQASYAAPLIDNRLPTGEASSSVPLAPEFPPSGSLPPLHSDASPHVHQVAKEGSGNPRRMKVFMQSHRELRSGDILSLSVAPPLDPEHPHGPVPARISTRGRVEKMHRQSGGDADVTLAVADPAIIRPGESVHAFLQHDIKHDQESRARNDTSELQGRWRLQSQQRGDGFDASFSGTIEAEADGDTWRVFTDGEFRYTQLLSADPFCSPKPLTLIHQSRGSDEPVIQRGIYRVDGDRLEVFYSFDFEKRPADYAGPVVAFEVRQVWVRVGPVGGASQYKKRR